MNERDKELWVQSQQWDSSDDGRGKLKIFESVEKFADLIRADAREAAEERVVDLFTHMQTPYLPDIVRAIRARGNK